MPVYAHLSFFASIRQGEIPVAILEELGYNEKQNGEVWP